MEDIKQRSLRLELLEQVETGKAQGEGPDVGYEVYYGRSENGEPALALTDVEVTNFLMTGLADITALHLVTVTKEFKDALRSVDGFVLRLRKATIEAIQARYGAQAMLGIQQNKVDFVKGISGVNKDHEEVIAALGDIPEWNKELLRKTLKNPKGQGDA
jgi:hypothetical protein